MSEPTIEIAEESDRAQIRATVVAAFRDDPAFRFFFPDEYVRQATAFTGFLFDSRAAGSSTWIVDGGAAVAMWDRPREAQDGRDYDIAGRLADSLDRHPALQRRVRSRRPASRLAP